jgi:hypothetical protein
MSFKEKYLKYKAKYIQLKNIHMNGGYIKGDLQITETKYNPEIKTMLDTNMPLCSYNEKNNFILINDSNYVLINKKLNEDYKLFQFDNKFNIKEIKENKKSTQIIEDNIQIPGINKMINGINLIQAFNYYNKNIFRNFFSNVWNTGYNYLNKLKDILYYKGEGVPTYQKNTNIVLSMIFMNKLDYIICFLHNIEKKLEKDTTNYHFVKTQKNNNNNFNEIKTGILFDYINRDDLYIDQLNINNFDDLKNNLIIILSNISTLKFNEQSQIDEFNFIMKIIKEVYTHIDANPNLIEQYNYSLFIFKYKNLFERKDEKAIATNFKALKSKFLAFKIKIKLEGLYKLYSYLEEMTSNPL